MRAGALALTVSLVLAAPAVSDAAVRSGLDRNDGVRLTLDGRVLTATLVGGTSEKVVSGKRIRAACSHSLRPVRRDIVLRTRMWPEDARRVSFVLRRDISRRAKWCLIETDRGSDVALAWFFPRKPVRFVAEGRGPSGEWWRLGGWLGRFAEPCALLRTRKWSTRPCFLELATGRTNLGARAFAPCEKDVFVFGVAARTWERVRVLLADGATVEAALFEPPRRSRVPERYFIAVLPEGTRVRAVEAVEPGGDLLRRPIGDRTATPCPT